MFVSGIRQDGIRTLGTDETSGWIWYSGQLLNEVLALRVPNMAGLRVLELGSGTGWLAIQLASRGARVTATDRVGASQRLIQNVFSQAPEIAANIEVHILDWTIPKRIEGSWDLIVATDTLYLQESYVPLLETILRHDAPKTILAYEQRKPYEEHVFSLLASQYGLYVSAYEELAINPSTHNLVYMITMEKMKL